VNEAYRRCCGIDIHKDTIVICALPAIGCNGQAVRKTYGTFRNDLIRMRVWLKQLNVTEIAMESTGVYWRPVWNILENEGFRLLGAMRSGSPSTCRMAGWMRASFHPSKHGSCG
jgi:transposase